MLSDTTAPCTRFSSQAEAGLPDLHATGVQTCALPISGRTAPGLVPEPPAIETRPGAVRPARPARGERSEERRVGEEGWPRASRGSSYRSMLETSAAS